MPQMTHWGAASGSTRSLDGPLYVTEGVTCTSEKLAAKGD